MNPLVAIAGTGLLGYAAVSIPVNARKARAKRAAVAKKPIVIDAAAYGLVPGDQLDARSAGPDPEADAVASGALAGDWRRAAAYLAGAGRDWDLRWYRLGILADAAVEDDAWVKAWRTEYPHDPAATLVHADALVMLAAKARGALRARYTTAEQFEGYRRLLTETLPVSQEAARMAPEDPSPWVVQLAVAQGLGWSYDDFRALWAEIVARDPYHFGAHARALQYWCAKWQGSHELMYAFAEQAAATAPPGSPLPVLRLYAIFEQQFQDNDVTVYRQPFVNPAIDATLEAAAHMPRDHHRVSFVRHLLAYSLFRTERYAEGVEQFHALGGHIGSIPWIYFTDPAKQFVHARTNTFVEWERAGRPGA
ncbi:hypothetical protein NX794_03035 [Streptomyces sp. LP11]|uniref:DUF4034 domain-containing protein n=1 Tax=Streptomyces pyxinicus TaxID=2970331 RepID=A0ABT2AVE5_9ACTN|nr:hypothetical protein [Streptomyces sp. LP11]MCS0600214.1 hypothetical protein [Streptomyces sp. LP11]